MRRWPRKWLRGDGGKRRGDPRTQQGETPGDTRDTRDTLTTQLLARYMHPRLITRYLRPRLILAEGAPDIGVEQPLVQVVVRHEVRPEERLRHMAGLDAVLDPGRHEAS